jgi:nitrite reductase (NO-forming)
MFETQRRRVLQAIGLGSAATVAGCSSSSPPTAEDTENVTATEETTTASKPKQSVDAETVAADPTDVPDPIDRNRSKTINVTLEAEEVTAEVEPGVTFDYMTFDGQIPGPMIRARVGDTIDFTMENLPDNMRPHNVDFHAVYGTGGGAVATTAGPGKGNSMRFSPQYPGAFIYHCAVPNLDMHISAGMFGMILVEPEGGMPEVDQELYFGQHELYTDADTGAEGHHKFDMDAMANENPTYVLLNGEKMAYAAANQGPVEVRQGDRVRVFLVTGGPNFSSNFHPIGNVWSEAYRDGGLPEDGEFDAYADKNIQTMKVPPGSCMIGEMDTPVTERIKLVDHALSRVVRKGALAEVDVDGSEDESVYDPDASGSSHDGPMYG